MHKHDFWYDLPPERIAQTPIADRSASRLLVVDKNTGEFQDRRFFEIGDFLNKGDCLVLNDTKVLPARLYGKTVAGGGKIEFLLLRDRGSGIWEVLTKPGKKAVPGAEFIFGDGELRATVLEVLENGNRVVQLLYGGNFMELLAKIGEMPLPHYIHEHLNHPDRYQTVYSREPGSVAAPTAGLHFTPELLKSLEEKGISIACLTLHVGVGTFRPVKEDDIAKHLMHTEYYELPEQAAETINRTKQAGGRVIPVGTTSCRTLESVYRKYGKIVNDIGFTDIFIYPPYQFGVIDGLITNFHLPESTLIMLVSAFAGRENTLNAYRHAIEAEYRFYSFGDACLFF